MRCGTKSLPRPNLGLGRRSEIALSGRCALWPRVVVAAPLCQAVCGVGLRTRLALLSSAGFRAALAQVTGSLKALLMRRSSSTIGALPRDTSGLRKTKKHLLLNTIRERRMPLPNRDQTRHYHALPLLSDHALTQSRPRSPPPSFIELCLPTCPSRAVRKNPMLIWRAVPAAI